jgi:hypothetical protein
VATWLGPDGTVCGVVDDGDGSSETCDLTGGPATVVHDRAGRPVLLIGVMPDGAVGRIAVDGDIVEAQTVTGPDDPSPTT